MKRTLLTTLTTALIALFGCIALATDAFQTSRSAKKVLPDVPVGSGTRQVTLPSGWRVTPAGKHIALPGDMPLKIVVLKNGNALVNTGGFHDHSLSLLDLRTGAIQQRVNLLKNWGGMAMDPEGDDIYLSGGGVPGDDLKREAAKRGYSADAIKVMDSPLYRVSFKGGKLAAPVGMEPEGFAPKDRFTSGVTAAKDGSLYALNINTNTVYHISESPRKVIGSAVVGYRPCAVVVAPNQKQIAVANWGDKSVSFLKAESLKPIRRVAVGAHPCDMVWAKDGRLFVANASSDTVSVLKDGAVIETIRVGIGGNTLGATPISLALTPNGKRLYVADAGLNAVVVADTTQAGHSSVLGFIPTGWYPSAVAVTPDGKRLLVGTGKGLMFHKNFPATMPFPNTTDDTHHKYDYIGDVLSGAVSIVTIPAAPKLAAYTKQVRSNLPALPETVVNPAQIADVTRNAFPKIKHILYIIRENRTYDQVFSDLKQGNGDPNLTMYGAKITPNAHALAQRTVLLDNLFCSGEVSEDGHQWCNAAYATDFTEKAWTNSYSDRGEPNGDARLTTSPGGYLWDNCAQHGKTYRSYGEFSGFHSDPKTQPVFDGPKSLKGHASIAWWRAKGTLGRDYRRADVFIAELHAAEKTGNLPNFMVMSLGEDHTSGLTQGAYTPFAAVASNDLALGKMVEAISHSRFWKNTAIFVIEDDAQNGPDHVDAHRTVGLLISPYARKGAVDSTLYTTASMVRTMELILGLPPMTQNDALAMPMYNSFTTTPNLAPYTAIGARIDLEARNPKPADGKPVAQLDFSDYDRADPTILNRQLWENAKPGVPMPAPVRSASLVR